MNQVDRVEVRCWNSKQKKMFLGKAGVDKIVTMGGSTSGPKAAKKAFGAASLTIVDQPVHSQQEADKIAEGLLNDMAIAYITGDGTCFGRPDLRAGKVIEIIAIGKRFSGSYYVTSATHTYSQSQGYTTTFTVRRNAT
jgi:phage protein D